MLSIGLRLGDAATRLSWTSVDLQAKRITLIPSKTEKKREVGIPIQPDLLVFFESVTLNDDSPDAPVFPTLAETPVNTMKGLSTTFVDIMAAADVDRGKPSRVLEEGQTAGKGRITYERGFHSLRHTFTTWLRTAGVSEEGLVRLAGTCGEAVMDFGLQAFDEFLVGFVRHDRERVDVVGGGRVVHASAVIG